MTLSAGEDFITRRIPFTIPANSTQLNQSVIVTLIDDDKLEPLEEGFRLVLIVDELRTSKNLVKFGRQLALFQINNRDDS